MDLGPRIAAWRKARGMTQREVATAIKVSPAAVCQWESAGKYKNPPSVNNLERLVAMFGLTMLQFYGAIPKKKKAT